MIVKNEEDVLARCLNSVGGLADEIIVIDTGSTDATKEIALKYTNLVYDFTWIDDLDVYKRQSLYTASRTIAAGLSTALYPYGAGWYLPL